MADQLLRLQGSDGNGIYGRLSTTGSRRLVVHIHGLTHHAEHLLEVTSSEFFEENGFDHFRFSLYWRAPDSRKLPQSTLSTHVCDVQTALDYFKPLYDEIFISAHSLGGLVVLIMNPAGVKAISLWDPSTDVSFFWAAWPALTAMPERQQQQLDYGNVYVLGDAMINEIAQYPDAKCLELAKAITTPVQFIIPQESISLASPHVSMDNYRKAFAGPFDLRRIAAANHVFSYRGNRQELFKATLGWFKKFAA